MKSDPKTVVVIFKLLKKSDESQSEKTRFKQAMLAIRCVELTDSVFIGDLMEVFPVLSEFLQQLLIERRANLCTVFVIPSNTPISGVLPEADVVRLAEIGLQVLDMRRPVGLS